MLLNNRFAIEKELGRGGMGVVYLALDTHRNGAPAVVIGPLYVPKTIDLCADGDTICNGAPTGGPTIAHASYGFNGMVNQAADFAAGRL